MPVTVTAGRNWRTSTRAFSSTWYRMMPTLACDFTMSHRRDLPSSSYVTLKGCTNADSPEVGATDTLPRRFSVSFTVAPATATHQVWFTGHKAMARVFGPGKLVQDYEYASRMQQHVQLLQVIAPVRACPCKLHMALPAKLQSACKKQTGRQAVREKKTSAPCTMHRIA